MARQSADRPNVKDSEHPLQTNFPPGKSDPSVIARYAAAIIAVLLGWLAREALTPAFGPTANPFMMFFAAVAMAAWYGGLGPGVLAVALSAATANWFFLEPTHSLSFRTVYDVAALAGFSVSCAFIVGAIEMMHRARARVEQETIERRRVEAELAELRGTFATTLGTVRDSAVFDPHKGRWPLLVTDFIKASPGRLPGAMFLAAALLLIGSTFFIYRVGLLRSDSQEKMTNELIVMQQLETFLSSLKDAETVQREYILTGDESYLEPYPKMLANVLTNLDGLQAFARSEELPKERIERVVALAQQKISLMEQRTRIRRDEGLDAALSSFHANPGKQAMDQIREEIGQMHSEEEREFAMASSRSSRAMALRTATFIASCLLNLIFLGWAFRRIAKEAAQRASAAFEASRQKELLATTLASIGDAVIATDSQGSVLFLNTEAERLTGWKGFEAADRPLAEVFRIVNEQTRQPAENPVEKVLRLGAVVGLANHTVLIARDGRETPIDDSAAPIRQPNGPLFGVVLVFRDFTERRRTEQAFRESAEREKAARGDAEQANHVKEEFLTTLSHELRNPLNAILGWVRLIEKNPSDPKTVNEGIEVISRNAKLQADLIADLLDMSRIVSGKVRLQIEDIHLSDVISAAIDSVRHAAESKNIRIQSLVSEIPDLVRGDPARLQQIVWNLLSNAIKFTPKEGRIQIVLAKKDSSAEIVVSDTGTGIRPDFLPYVFERFRQADGSTARQYGGLGLGLSIVKHLVELHGGTVGAMSDGDGKGATFTVRIPQALMHAPAELESCRLESNESASPAICDSVDLTGIRVLAIDDQEDARELLKRVLEECHAEVVTAASTEEALDALEGHRPHVVLCDIGLPGKDGYEFIKEMRNRGDETPALAVTAFARSEDRLRAFRAGYQGHISKPIEPAELVATVGVFVKSQIAGGGGRLKGHRNEFARKDSDSGGR